MITGGAYYLIFWFVLYRLLLIEDLSKVRVETFMLLLFMMIVNAQNTMCG